MVLTKKLRLLQVIDATGSMAAYISAAKQASLKIVQEISQKSGIEAEVGLITYRDHRDCPNLESLSFTSDMQAVCEKLENTRAMGGDDIPEALAPALASALAMFRTLPKDGSLRMMVVITDAPPHGVGCPGDFYPNGDPNGPDAMQVLEDLRRESVIIFTVAANPNEMQRVGLDYLIAAATKTGGQAVSLSNASSLGSLLCGGAAEAQSFSSLATDLHFQEAVSSAISCLERMRMETPQLYMQQVDEMTGLGSGEDAERALQAQFVLRSLGNVELEVDAMRCRVLRSDTSDRMCGAKSGAEAKETYAGVALPSGLGGEVPDYATRGLGCDEEGGLPDYAPRGLGGCSAMDEDAGLNEACYRSCGALAPHLRPASDAIEVETRPVQLGDVSRILRMMEGR